MTLSPIKHIYKKTYPPNFLSAGAEQTLNGWLMGALFGWKQLIESLHALKPAQRR